MDPNTFFALCIVIRLAACVGCAVLASNKQRNAAGWAIGGFLLPILVLVIACMQSKETHTWEGPVVTR